MPGNNGIGKQKAEVKMHVSLFIPKSVGPHDYSKSQTGSTPSSLKFRGGPTCSAHDRRRVTTDPSLTLARVVIYMCVDVTDHDNKMSG